MSKDYPDKVELSTRQEKVEFFESILETVAIQNIHFDYVGGKRVVRILFTYEVDKRDLFENRSLQVQYEVDEFPENPDADLKFKFVDDPEALAETETVKTEGTVLNYEWFYEMSRRENVALREIARLYLDRTSP